MHLNDIGQWLSVSNITFLEPVHAGDTVCCYTDVKRIGRTSITLDVEVWVLRQGQGEQVKVTHAEFTFVAVHEDGRPRQLAPSGAKGVAPPARNSRRATRRQERSDVLTCARKSAFDGEADAGSHPRGESQLHRCRYTGHRRCDGAAAHSRRARDPVRDARGGTARSGKPERCRPGNPAALPIDP